LRSPQLNISCQCQGVVQAGYSVVTAPMRDNQWTRGKDHPSKVLLQSLKYQQFLPTSAIQQAVVVCV
jgi:hypothetical protein